MRSGVMWMERHQALLYLAALAVGATAGLLLPALSPVSESLITPVLALMLYATFLAVPFRALADAARDVRFLLTVLGLNFLLIPLVVFGLSRFVAADLAVLVGVLFVLLAPCVDYVVTFTGLAGGAQEKILAVSPAVMIAQMILLPGYLWLWAPEALAAIDFGPFLHAFLLLIVAPLGAAILTQLATRWRPGEVINAVALGSLVPLVILTLLVVVASQIGGVVAELPRLIAPIALFVAFAAIAVPLGWVTAQSARLAIPEQRAVIFSGVTRNSLVVLPLALALPASLSFAPLVIVSQTLVELVVMVILIQAVPRVVRVQTP